MMTNGKIWYKKNPCEAWLKISFKKLGGKNHKLINRVKREQMNVNWINLNRAKKK